MNYGVVRAGTRTSRLATAQTNHVLEALTLLWPELGTIIEPYETRGDRALGALQSLPGGKGLFTSALEDALRAGNIDIAVHSLKDLPTEPAADLVVGAILGRKTAQDVLVATEPWTIDSLPEGASIGTGSRRRAAQLLHYRRDLAITPLRGNVDTRIQKMTDGAVDAIVLAAAGLQRLGLDDRISSYLPFSVMLPAPGQGALAVQCRADDDDMLSLLASIDCPDTRSATTAERIFLQALGGGCMTPVAAYARRVDNGMLTMGALVATPDGRRVITADGEGKDPCALGQVLANDALQQGAAEVLRHA